MTTAEQTENFFARNQVRVCPDGARLTVASCVNRAARCAGRGYVVIGHDPEITIANRCRECSHLTDVQGY